mmetsp:Transcript_5575/g.12996  ORF Transcript_5575/g.12996 Transcript_5575/m.12996 type:complete len:232 (-) Transcript_5575:44-739(-)
MSSDRVQQPSGPMVAEARRRRPPSGEIAFYRRGLRRLRERDYAGAAELLAQAWEARKCTLRFDSLAEPAEPASSELEQEAEVSDLSSDASEGSCSQPATTSEQGTRGARRRLLRPLRTAVIDDQLPRLPLLLCLAYERLEEWQRIDELAEEALAAMGPADDRGIPELASEDAEERWVRLLVRRGVACSRMGSLARAEASFELALRVQPRDREAKLGLQCVQFLREQLVSIE